jgi:tetratricopeptide (TPR) repeat protein
MVGARIQVLVGLALGVLVVASCTQQQEAKPGTTGQSKKNQSVAKRTEPLEGDRLVRFLESHQQGLGAMEKYEYPQAVSAFRSAVELAPDLSAPKVNLAIALLNDSGERAEEAKKKREDISDSSISKNFEEALQLLESVIRAEPKNLHAHYCRGIIYEYLGRSQEAHQDYKLVSDTDPTDGYARLKVGMTLPDPKRPGYPAGPEQASELIPIYTKALECNPYLVTAMYRLQQAYTWASVFGAKGNPARKAELEQTRDALLRVWERLDRDKTPSGNGEAVEQTYGDAGPYATVVDPFGLRSAERAPEQKAPRFKVPSKLEVTLPDGDRWVQQADFSGPHETLGRVRERFGAPILHGDFDRDGLLDLYMCAAVKTADGVRDVLLKNLGDGRFQDVSTASNLPRGLASTGAAAGDFDADGYLDLILTGIGRNSLLRNVGGRSFEDVSTTLGEVGPPSLNLTARWIDIDQDGDLDLYIIRYCDLESASTVFRDGTPPQGLPNLAFRNDGRPSPLGGDLKADAPSATDFYEKATQGLSLAWTRWEGAEHAALTGGDEPHTGLAVLDIDVDRDLDLVLLSDGRAPSAAINDRLGRFHSQTLSDLDPKGLANGAVVLDLDKDRRPDLVLVKPDGRMTAWRNQAARTEQGAPGFALTFWAIDARLWRTAQALDLDLDTWTDLLALPASSQEDPPVAAWARNEGSRLAHTPLALGPDSTSSLLGIDAGDLAGNPLPDLLLLRDGEGPYLAVNEGNGNNWLGLALGGRWKFGKGSDGGPSRSNPQAVGTRVLLQGPNLEVSFDDVPSGSTLAQSAGPKVLGLGSAEQALLVRLTWPDGVMQSELNASANQVLKLREQNRKTGSCPVLFTFDGERFVCIGDFLGGGGLGYLVAPGVYGAPDRDEAVSIRGDQLRAVDGVFRMSIAEPMDELAYLDQITLDVIDRPADVEAFPDERFAPGSNRPTGELLAWRDVVRPQTATDLKGNDVVDKLLAFDNKCVDTFEKRAHWIGYAERHGIVLNFANQLEKFKPTDRLVLCVAGWVEYPYSQTNYAAATAGIALQPPVLERLADDGSWRVLELNPGYPAGLPRMTTLELTGKLGGPKCVLRLTTNMECYYDQVFVAVVDETAAPRVTNLPISTAVLGYKGFMREVSTDGSPPLLYDYDLVDPAPLARLAGKVTRQGDVAALLSADDDQLCLVGPGDEVQVSFNASELPALPAGWKRSFVLRSIGYCKDADPFTAGSDTVGPLPWKGMPDDYPFDAKHQRPHDPAYEAYLKTYQSRDVAH